MTYLYLFIGTFIGFVLFALCNMASEKRDVARYRSALWEVIRSMRLVDTYHVEVRAILEKHGIEIPDDEVVW